jgi:HEAT repeat protein
LKGDVEMKMGTDEPGGRRLTGDLEDAARRGDTRYLLDALDDPSFEIRIAAAAGLGELGGKKAALALTSVAKDRWGQRPEVRIAALRSLGRIREPDRYASTLEAFINRDNRKVVKAARKMLQEADPEGYPRRLAASGSVDHGAMRIYGISREPAALPVIREYLEARLEAGDLTGTSNWGKVYAAVRALGNIGGPESAAVLEELMGALDTEQPREVGTLAKGRMDKIRDVSRASLDQIGKR